MKKYDFLFIYETKNRELESLCLLKYELERRGYSVALVETWWCMQHYYLPVSAKVLVTFALYNDAQVHFSCSFGQDFKAIVNLQWEQIRSNLDETQLDSLSYISGCARSMIHIAWGSFTVDKLVQTCSVPEQNVVLTGHIAMDFVKPRLCGYYMERDKILAQYHIDSNLKVLLFISSFTYVDVPEEILVSDVYQKIALPVHDFKNISIMSQAILFKWLEEILPHHSDCIFIYRPHPAEINSKKLEKLEEDLPNFRVIRDYSVKQWISIADKVYAWYSTTAADAYFCEKSFDILRPVELPYNMDLVLYNGCKFITTLQDFDHSIKNPSSEFPIKKEVFEHFYDFHKETYTYVKICDTLESVLHEPIDRCSEFRKYSQFYIMRRLIRMPLRIVKLWYLRFLSWAYTLGFFGKLNGPTAKKAKYEAYVRQMIQNNHASKHEIQMLQNRIQQIIISNSQESL